MIHILSRLIARFRYRAVADELAAVERQLKQQEAYRQYLLDEERKASVALLIAEGGDVTPVLRESAIEERRRRQAPRKVAMR